MNERYQKPEGSYISFMSNKVKAYGGINLAQGIPGFDPPKELLEQLNKSVYDKVHQYAPGDGNRKLLELLIEHYQNDFLFKYDNFLVVQGATEALSLLMVYLKKNINTEFSTLAFDPVYESYMNLPAIFNTGFQSFHFNKNGSVDFESLQKRCIEHNVKVIFLNTPGNPYGKIWSEQEIKKLLNICFKHNIYLIIDAVYRELYFEKKPYIPLEFFNKNIFYINSFSKVLSITGWRIGYLIAHKEHMQKIKAIHDYTGLCAPSVLQVAIAGYLQNSNYGKKYIEDIRKKLSINFSRLSTVLRNLSFIIPPIDGGYFIWTRLPEEFSDGFKLAIDLYDKAKVAVIPGEHFSANATNFIRVNIARQEEEIEKGIHQLTEFFS